MLKATSYMIQLINSCEPTRKHRCVLLHPKFCGSLQNVVLSNAARKLFLAGPWRRLCIFSSEFHRSNIRSSHSRKCSLPSGGDNQSTKSHFLWVFLRTQQKFDYYQKPSSIRHGTHKVLIGIRCIYTEVRISCFGVF